MVQKVWYTYDDIHKTVKNIAAKVQNSGVQYDAMIAIGGGGFIPARMLRCFLDIPIYAVTTAYYLNETEGKTADKVQKIQWLDPIPETLIGKNILVVDEVDDSRTTMEFVLNELIKDGFNQIGVAVIHNKLKDKVGKIPEGIAYFSGLDIQDWWINYPWDAVDIDAHNRRAASGVQEA
ncbi:phosphoribosyltransferase [Wielerella bovis]|uniref:phosphoribosyltransferase n=1 Tax=Wielerella bovis TaxID=2917790 RepID=UPI002018FA1F|nr:phosphoribosyltransferase [Wielerella bovis]MCG7656323.1 phosphoribosyltransferase [Wielerella bovis]MCG7658548.1 phosphoribosyltransferase [Wielerella bovis]ULJ60657.1 phosphoribosyltransferase [Wielerella bovis]ULJ62848.1 phosphoribosyltransferase [Wielerella bovis]ULJ69655.1 phosphoribosyltransferase [Wielerella bovis]